MSAHALLDLLNEFGKSDKMRCLPSIYHIFTIIKNNFCNCVFAVKMSQFYHKTGRCYGHHFIT